MEVNFYREREKGMDLLREIEKEVSSEYQAKQTQLNFTERCADICLRILRFNLSKRDARE
jgi:hypothetical protein